MESSAHQQAYDRGSTIFSPDGRLYQVEYAREAVERGSPSVGVVTDDGAVLAARKRLRSPLLESTTVEKIHRIDDHLAIASAGHAADARQLVDVARRVGQQHRVRYGEPIDTRALATHVADHVQEHTQSGGSRPYGSALLVAGIDRGGSDGAGGRPRLFEVDPSGTPYGWRATAIGHDAAAVRGFFEDELADGSRRDLQQGTAVALEALDLTTDDDLAPAALDAWTLDATSATVAPLSDDDLEGALEELDDEDR
ncbi:archaeal proteasome endopeptidase complex subunit alpha [Halosolutus gelatinilyticus]|uniref:archaeal proteasome endopeptidase complex subunit alpha n=1 Tax=Halosolutus gelatinilyticus TaxID=2931975 RepID=UPI001FF3A03B|nr:archaeal proteasome endopeptidase complex subunit alpha [Halosolutus gelatinilyticus]